MAHISNGLAENCSVGDRWPAAIHTSCSRPPPPAKTSHRDVAALDVGQISDIRKVDAVGFFERPIYAETRLPSCRPGRHQRSSCAPPVLTQLRPAAVPPPSVLSETKTDSGRRSVFVSEIAKVTADRCQDHRQRRPSRWAAPKRFNEVADTAG
jgi:hypothetical protein